MYLENVISVATMISGLLVSAGVGIAVLFKTNKGVKENLKIVALLYSIGVVFGVIIEFIGFNVWKSTLFYSNMLDFIREGWSLIKIPPIY